MKLYDAHAHLVAPELLKHWKQVKADLDHIGLQKVVVNGTSPADWPAILEFARSEPCIIPAVGLHPWKVNHAEQNWQTDLLRALDSGASVIGEIGLDQWVKGYDLQRQQNAFCWQLAQAHERNLPASIHCLKAIGPLMDILRNYPLPRRGIHLHAYSGPVALIPELVQLGTYFSFNAGQLKGANAYVLERIRAVPDERLLIETDAPNMLPPVELRTFQLPALAAGRAITHPATLLAGYTALATIRSLSTENLSQLISKNFNTFFLG
jgi:TatD DNase family protein